MAAAGQAFGLARAAPGIIIVFLFLRFCSGALQQVGFTEHTVMACWLICGSAESIKQSFCDVLLLICL